MSAGPATLAGDRFAVSRRESRGRAPGIRRPPRYTREGLVAAIRQWAARYGEPPQLADWDPARARRRGQAWRAERFAQGTWPTVRMVCRQFGTFGDAIVAAGFERPRAGGRKAQLSNSDEVLRAIREWTLRYGDTPTQADWDPVRARRLGQEWRIARYQAGDWPSVATARKHFGSLGEAVRAAGLLPRPQSDSAVGHRQRRERNRRALAVRPDGTVPGTLAADLADDLRRVAAARAGDDDSLLRRALVALAGTALTWAEHATTEVVADPDEDDEAA